VIFGLILGLFCGVCYTMNIDDLLDGQWGKWLLSPALIPYRIIRFFTHPPVA
jgi:hypothetical protein